MERLKMRAAAIEACFAIWLVCAPAAAQPATQTAPSPFAPGDLSSPIFDTITPNYGSGTVNQHASTIVAEVGGAPITLGDVGDAIHALPPPMSNQSFESLYPLILNQLIRESAIANYVRGRGDDEDPTLRRRVHTATNRVLANEFLRQTAERDVTEAELLDRYKRDVAGQPGPQEVHVRAIAARTEQDAMTVIAALRDGMEFGEAARRFSVDATGKDGGDLGFQTRDMLNPEVSAVAFSLAPGQLLNYPVLSGGYWMVVHVEERRRAPQRAFPLVRESLRQAVALEKVATAVEALIKKTKVRFFDLAGQELQQ
jgi:peptidyl-prolyl cis-trans isomerase C